MSSFEVLNSNNKKTTFRFDFYPTMINAFSWKKEVDKLPEY